MSRFVNAALLGAVLATSVAIGPAVLRAQDHGVVVYEDKAHHDKHEWNEREDRAYRMYWSEQHREYREFSSLNPHDQAAYWNWRHHHSDADLHIEVH